MILHTKYQSCRLCGFREEDFLRFSYTTLCKSDKPWGGAIFGPRVIICTNLVEEHRVKLQTKYERSRLYCFREEDFIRFSNEKLISPRCDHFWTGGHNLNKLSKVRLGDDKYQISKLKAVWFQEKIF